MIVVLKSPLLPRRCKLRRLNRYWLKSYRVFTWSPAAVIWGWDWPPPVQRRMDLESLRPLTVDGDSAMYASSIAYHDAGPDRPPLWWSLDSQFAWLRVRGLTYCARDWFKAFKQYVAEDVGSDSYIMRQPNVFDIRPICTTTTLLTSIWHTVEVTRSTVLENACLSSLKHIANVVSAHITDALSVVTVRSRTPALSVRVNQHGQVSGLADVLLSMPHSASLNALNTSWEHMRQRGLLQGGMLAQSHHMTDVICFATSVQRFRSRTRRAPLASSCQAWIGHLRRGIVQWMANAMDHYTLHEYTQHHDMNKPPPAARQVRVRTHVDAIWNMLQQAQQSSASLPQVLQVRSGDADAGGSSRQASRWENLVQAMYRRRTELVWPTINHLCMAADGSTHGYHDTLLALAYSWELDQATYPALQHIVPGSVAFIHCFIHVGSTCVSEWRPQGNPIND